ncbi:hypothetical protein BDS110ZK4_27880 [Bradyrhizobium diazoefficiens]|uniref:Uncharacterized protein n=1 Tax=Bradyrhizobium diazoefficiens TaxID=1355477 RepID=A0A809X565_9BRAD|nr:hypothetical protein XF1B_48060 [Bradyrhizobium diazoefficiens]BCE48390.1 hypothetical protein XF4B_47390 [Bradyrhizobium diazoefficiens]BCE91906.1 hypothetical protein XF10B_47040 [Bradyrhizobium diazoefficiens]BCF26834.1 hypothetical protein XF14B_47860 [Bradyrhizobium diazoefficiens]
MLTGRCGITGIEDDGTPVHDGDVRRGADAHPDQDRLRRIPISRGCYEIGNGIG